MIGKVLALAALSMPIAASAQTAPPPVAASLLSTVLRVQDATAEESFYRDVLGMKTMMSRDLGAIHETMLSFGGDARSAGIMLVSNLPGATTPLRGVGISRLVLNVVDLDAVLARMDQRHQAHGAPHDPAPGFRVLTITDPEGNELELVQRPVSTQEHPHG